MCLGKVKTKFIVKELFEKKTYFSKSEKSTFKSVLKSALNMKAGYGISRYHTSQGMVWQIKKKIVKSMNSKILQKRVTHLSNKVCKM